MKRNRSKVPLMRALCGKLRRRAGLSYLELMITMFILALCTGIISDTMALGAKYLREQTKQSQAIILLDTLCAVVQNDLTYATSYDKTTKIFTTTAEDTKEFKTQYGIITEPWDSSKALSENNAMGWTSISDAIAQKIKGEIIRRGKVPDSTNPDVIYYYYTALTSSQDYSNKSMSHITNSSNNSKDDLKATIDMTKLNGIFTVTIKIYDGSDTLLASKETEITPLKDIQE